MPKIYPPGGLKYPVYFNIDQVEGHSLIELSGIPASRDLRFAPTGNWYPVSGLVPIEQDQLNPAMAGQAKPNEPHTPTN
jgi:hypothetical protein